ncbi:unnamed protein product [Protopolystoma xenopodis]|uniref:Uncharacterized protein n=1 Tax=Protopolystoma xenopodis TaxID=117903 RepID=A0A3S4ZY94_9PLAT|nr:unnamed protein product [Protopolystoma xenopodis]
MAKKSSATMTNGDCVGTENAMDTRMDRFAEFALRVADAREAHDMEEVDSVLLHTSVDWDAEEENVTRLQSTGKKEQVP